MEVRELSLEEIGGPPWFEQQQALQSINVQAHAAVLKDAQGAGQQLLSSKSVVTLIHQLIHVEVWLDKLFPLLRDFMAEELDSVTAYLLIYPGAVLANLLEVVLFHEGACAALPEESQLELCDFCSRCLHKLGQRNGTSVPAELQPEDEAEALDGKKREVEFAMALSGLAICRYLAESADKLPLGAVARLCEVNDSLGALLAVLERRPWEAGQPDSEGHRVYQNGAWQAANAFTDAGVSEHEAQAWLLLCCLLSNAACRTKCGLEEHLHGGRLMALRARLTDTLAERLPFLKQLCFHLDVLALEADQQPDRKPPRRGFIIEEVTTIRQRLLQASDWQQLAVAQRRNILEYRERQAGRGPQVPRGLLATVDFMLDQEAAADKRKTKEAEARQSAVSIAVWEGPPGGPLAPCAELHADVDSSAAAEEVQVQAASGAAVRGTRLRLKAFGGPVLPAQGKLAFNFRGRRAEALLKLPAAPTKAAVSEMAPVVWITAGLLATQGVTLQLKLVKAESAAVRDRQRGDWSLYRAVGGAVTTRVDGT